MRVQTQGPGPHPDFAIAGSVVTVGNLSIDCAERQGDIQTVIDLRRAGGAIREGGDGHQVASIHIPPRRYEMVETAEADDGEDGPGEARQALPLDPNEVLVTIWTE